MIPKKEKEIKLQKKKFSMLGKITKSLFDDLIFIF